MVMKMRAKRDGERAAIASSPQQVLHATEKHIIVDHERSQVHLVSSTPSTQVPVLNSYHILNTSGLLGSDPRSLFSAHLLTSIQQLAAATATAATNGSDARYQIPLTIQMPSQLYAPASNIQVAAQPPTSTIQMPQQILMSHHDLNVLNNLNLTESNLNIIQGAQQHQTQYENIISRLMRGFIETETNLDGIPNVDVHLMPLPLTTSSGQSTVTTTTNSIANNKQENAKPSRKYKTVKNNNEKLNHSESGYKARNKRKAAVLADSTTAAKNKRNKSAVPNGNGSTIIPGLTPNYNHKHPIFNDITADFLTTPIKAPADNSHTTSVVPPESGKPRKQKNAISTPRKKDKVDHSKTISSSSASPPHVHSNFNNNNGRDKVFSCPICKRTFGYKHVLQNHERTHTGEKPFECNICSKKFTRDHHLKTHMRLHTGEKPYQCSHCDRQFVQVANLRRHLRVHTGERPYACDICASKFSDSNQLKAHNLIHKGEKPYNCVECGGKFRRRHHLIHHKCNNNSTPQTKMDDALTPILEKGETICTYMVPAALSPPLSSSPVAPAGSIHSGGSSNSSLSSNGGTTRVNGTKRERKSRETRRIIRPEGLPQSGPAVSPISVTGRKIMSSLELPEEQTQPQDLSFANSNSITAKFKQQQQRHFTGSHSSCSGTSLSSPSPPTSGSHQEDSIFAHCNSEEEPPEFTSASSNCSGDEEHRLSGMTPPTSCSSHGGDHHQNLLLEKSAVEEGDEKMDWRFAQFHNTRDKLKGDV